MTKYYPLREINGGHIYDIYGLFFGEICGYEYYMDTIRLKTCITYRAETTVPDTETLKNKLVEKGIKLTGSEPLEYLVNMARQLKIDIPYKTISREVRMLKAYVNIDEIAVIDRYIYERKPRILILLKKPREAYFRGWSQTPLKQSPLPENIIGRHVVSISNGYLGVVKELVLGAGELGLRIAPLKPGEIYISWLRFLSDLRRKGLSREYSILASIRDPLKHRRISIEEYDEIIREMKNKGVGEDLIIKMDEYIEYTTGYGGVIDIPFRRVMYIHDIIVTY